MLVTFQERGFSNMSGGKEHVRGGGYGKGFALIVVLFILLIIVGAAAVGGANYGGQCGGYGKGGYGGYGGYGY